MLTVEKIREGVGKCLVKSGTTYRADQFEIYKAAIEKETNKSAKWVLERLVENAEVAEKRGFPLCDDTGIPHLFLEVGNDIDLPKGWLLAIQEGVAQGLRVMPGRPMAVKGNDIERVEQSAGLSEDPADVLPVPAITKPVPGNRLSVTVLLFGGGPEIRSKTYRVFHKRSINKVLEEAAGWIAAEVKNLGCTPCTIAMGVGRSHTEASMRMVEAIRNGEENRANGNEKSPRLSMRRRSGRWVWVEIIQPWERFSILVLYGPVEFESYVQGLAVAWSRDGQRFPLILRVRLRSNNMFS